MAIPPAYAARSLRDVWTTIVRVLSPSPPQRKNAGGKGPESILSPGVWGKQEVWHLQPVILYESPANQNDAPDRIQLMQGETKIQTFEVKGKSYSKLPVAAKLMPGQRYQIQQLKGKDNRVIDQSIAFQVMADSPARQAITEQLTKLDCQFPGDPDQRLQERLQVFVAAGLWSDALQELSDRVTGDDDWRSLKAETVDQWVKAEN